MADHYGSMQHLYQAEPKESYKVTCKKRPSNVLISSPHGGKIEWMSTPVAEAIAGEEFSFYDFSGLLKHKNFEKLHVTSSRYDCPKLNELNSGVDITVTIHGCKGDTPFTLIGGRDQATIDALTHTLKEAGFLVRRPPSHLSGQSERNIANQNRRNMGVQLEMSTGLRNSFQGSLLFRQLHPYSSDFKRYTQAIKQCLLTLSKELS